MYAPRFRTKKNGVLVLSKKEIDIMGERFVVFCNRKIPRFAKIILQAGVGNFAVGKSEKTYIKMT